MRIILAWPHCFLGAERYRLQYKYSYVGAYTASNNALRLKSSDVGQIFHTGHVDCDFHQAFTLLQVQILKRMPRVKDKFTQSDVAQGRFYYERCTDHLRLYVRAASYNIWNSSISLECCTAVNKEN